MNLRKQWSAMKCFAYWTSINEAIYCTEWDSTNCTHYAVEDYFVDLLMLQIL